MWASTPTHLEGGRSRGVSAAVSGRAHRAQSHRRGRGAVCQPDAPWLEPLRALPVPLGKDRVVLRLAGQGDLLLLRLPRGRRRDQLYHADRGAGLSRRGTVSCKACGAGGPGGRELSLAVPEAGAPLGAVQGRGAVLPPAAVLPCRNRSAGVHTKAGAQHGNR